jgi:hypothetical protein
LLLLPGARSILVVAGRFREEITIPFFGQAELRWSLGDSDGEGHAREALESWLATARTHCSVASRGECNGSPGNGE